MPMLCGCPARRPRCNASCQTRRSRCGRAAVSVFSTNSRPPLTRHLHRRGSSRTQGSRASRLPICTPDRVRVRTQHRTDLSNPDSCCAHFSISDLIMITFTCRAVSDLMVFCSFPLLISIPALMQSLAFSTLVLVLLSRSVPAVVTTGSAFNIHIIYNIYSTYVCIQYISIQQSLDAIVSLSRCLHFDRRVTSFKCLRTVCSFVHLSLLPDCESLARSLIL